MNTSSKLDQLHQKRTALEQITNTMLDDRLKILEPIQADLDELEAKHQAERLALMEPLKEALEALDVDTLKDRLKLEQEIAVLEPEIKSEVLTHKGSISGSAGSLMAVYTPEKQAADQTKFDHLLLFTEDEFVKKQLEKCVTTKAASVAIRRQK